MSQYVRAIDPGVGYYADAVFRAGYLDVVGFFELDVKCKDATQRILRTVRPVHDLDYTTVIEEPWIRPGGKSRPEDIKHLYGAAIFLASNLPNHSVEFVKPEKWKGNVPKKVMDGRIRSRLYNEENAFLKYQLSVRPRRQHEHIIDAVGIGLWYLGRFK